MKPKMLRSDTKWLCRMVHKRVRLTNSDRLFFIQLYRWFPSILQVVAIVQPQTLVPRGDKELFIVDCRQLMAGRQRDDQVAMQN